MDDIDGKTFEALVSDGVRRFGHRVHAYGSLPRQVRLVIEVGSVPLARIMQSLGYRYTRHFNDRHGRSGALFHGRYRAVLVDADHHLVPLVRYIHRAPVVAGLCNGAHRYRWSSHRAYLGLDVKDWVTQDFVLAMLGPTRDVALEVYRETMAWPGEGPSARAMDYGFEGGVLGDADFRAALRTGGAGESKPRGSDISLDRLVERVAHARGLAPAALCARGRGRAASEARQIVGYLAFESGIATLTEVADFFGRDLTTLSRGVERLRRRMRSEAGLGAAITGLLPA